MTWSEAERRQRRRPWDGKEKRKVPHLYEHKMIEEKKNGSIRIPSWTFPLIFTILITMSGTLITWGSVTTRLNTVEKQNTEDAAVNVIVYKQETIIPVIQQDVKDIKESQKAMVEKEDRHYEAMQSSIKEILRAVKA